MAKTNSTTLTADRARELLRYDPETGKLFWRVNAGRWGRIPGGTEVGYIDADRYWKVMIDGHMYYTHRLAWLVTVGAWPTDEIDHINGNGLDNRWCNLREVSSIENKRNSKRRNDNTSGTTGVDWDRARCKWRAQIQVCGINILLGRFDSLSAAVDVRMAAECRYDFHENHGRAA